jgi:hypothetical protein
MRAVGAALVAFMLILGPSSSFAADKKAGNGCRKLPSGKRIVRLTLKPQTEIGDLVVWISSITCRQFLLSGSLDTHRTVTILAPQLITPEESYALFLEALDSVGFTVVQMGRFFRVVETAAAKTFDIPFYVDKPKDREAAP